MAANAYRPHLLVVPEDDANRQIMNGFRIRLSSGSHSMDLQPPAGGWRRVKERFEVEILPKLPTYPHRLVLLLIDCDACIERLQELRESVPADFASRVFVLGVRTEPERLRRELGSFTTIGESIADHCNAGSEQLWEHPLLAHNLPEVRRLRLAAGKLLGFPE